MKLNRYLCANPSACHTEVDSFLNDLDDWESQYDLSLLRCNHHVLCGTPGKMWDLTKKRILNVDKVRGAAPEALCSDGGAPLRHVQ